MDTASLLHSVLCRIQRRSLCIPWQHCAISGPSVAFPRMGQSDVRHRSRELSTVSFRSASPPFEGAHTIPQQVRCSVLARGSEARIRPPLPTLPPSLHPHSARMDRLDDPLLRRHRSRLRFGRCCARLLGPYGHYGLSLRVLVHVWHCWLLLDL